MKPPRRDPVNPPAPRTIWWLEGGTEQCPVCLQRYAYEVEYRCIDCDAPVCPFCIVTVRRGGDPYCPGCTPPEGGG